MRTLHDDDIKAASGGVNLITAPIMLVLSPITALTLYARKESLGYGKGTRVDYFDMWGIAISQIFLK